MAEPEAARPRFEARVEALLEQMDTRVTAQSSRMTGVENRMLSLETRMATARELHAWATMLLAVIVASGVLSHFWR
jgi:negative regulator of sigma E activity